MKKLKTNSIFNIRDSKNIFMIYIIMTYYYPNITLLSSSTLSYKVFNYNKVEFYYEK